MMMKTWFIVLLLPVLAATASDPWQPAGERIRSPWADKADPTLPLPDYPRPQMVRPDWLNLNGLWDYALTDAGSYFPSQYDGKILVPFAIESALSGVGKTVGENRALWYRRSFTVPGAWKGKKLLLHFGAADWRADVWVNGIKAGYHTGGYTPFTLEISGFLQQQGDQQLVVRVWDPTDRGTQPRGKQVEKPGGIWYTAVTGLWQTVWLEPVNSAHISGLKTTPDIDHGTVTITAGTEGMLPGDILRAQVSDGERAVSSGRAAAGQALFLEVPGATLWSPETPFLYGLEVSIVRQGKVVDRVTGYFGMRKISARRDANGIVRLQLNNRDYFQFGPLDQGWWPDGLYTAPTDEALHFDIRKTRELGFNMIRKHVKVEPARWYYHADREGILVWQDMPSGDRSPQWQTRQYYNGPEFNRSSASEENYRKEWKEIIDLLDSHPCVVVWVPFNEAWGQFKTPEIVEWTKNYDPTRLVNPASGGNHYDTGDMLDMHNYPDPVIGLYDSKRSCVLGEYGGIGLALEGHLWDRERNWGYVQYKTGAEATDAYVALAEKLKTLIPLCYSAAVYTQTTDVEIEVNGLMTYDRRVVKLDEARVRKVNREICRSLEPQP